MSAKIAIRGIKRLEVTMRDVQDGLEDAASYINYQSSAEAVEVLSIEPAGRAISPLHDVIPFNSSNSVDSKYNTNIVDYLIQRELKRSA